jgi:polyisoprenoid-binding protein YceI
MKNFVKYSFLGFLFLSVKVFAQKKLSIDKSASKIVYAMKHPMHDWTGTSKDVNSVIVYNEATKAIQQVAVAIKVSSFDSGNSNRDSHMVEVLESIKYPTISFSSSAVTIVGETVTAKGNLTFHGVTKPMTITGTLKEAGKKLQINADFKVLLTDFKIVKPTLLGVACEDELKMKLNVTYNL